MVIAVGNEALFKAGLGGGFSCFLICFREQLMAVENQSKIWHMFPVFSFPLFARCEKLSLETISFSWFKAPSQLQKLNYGRREMGEGP